MKAVKANKEYEITESEKKGYIDQGFDIIGDEGKTIAYGRGKTVSYDEYMRVVKELEELKASLGSDDELDSKTVEELKAYAEEKGVDLGQASSKEGIIKKIRAAIKE